MCRVKNQKQAAIDRPMGKRGFRERNMTTRRNFSDRRAASGIAFCSCSLLDAAHAQPKRRPAGEIDGKRVKTIDVHSHCLFP